MTIRILNSSSMSPWFPRCHVGAPCLVIDTDQGLVLVDTGLGLHDYEHPSRMVRLFQFIFGIINDSESTAVRQLKRLGHDPEQVRHIVMTHLHFDHAGGLSDFAHAQVHAHKRELDAVLHPRHWIELAYDPADFKHGINWVLYDQVTDQWLGLDAIRMPFTPEMFLVPLFGHTRGHCGVAVRDGDGWLFQCADALPTNVQFDLTPDWLNRLVLGPHVPRLRAWASAHPEVRLLAGHMWQSFFETGSSLQPVVPT